MQKVSKVLVTSEFCSQPKLWKLFLRPDENSGALVSNQKISEIDLNKLYQLRIKAIFNWLPCKEIEQVQGCPPLQFNSCTI